MSKDKKNLYQWISWMQLPANQLYEGCSSEKFRVDLNLQYMLEVGYASQR